MNTDLLLRRLCNMPKGRREAIITAIKLGLSFGVPPTELLGTLLTVRYHDGNRIPEEEPPLYSKHGMRRGNMAEVGEEMEKA